MRAFFAALVAFFAIYHSSSSGLAQTTPADAASVPSTVLDQNPTIAEEARVDPTNVSRVIAKLKDIGTGTVKGALRGGANPTTEESTQIASNPLFAEAFAHDPVSALAVLRWVNQDLAKAHKP